MAQHSNFFVHLAKFNLRRYNKKGIMHGLGKIVYFAIYSCLAIIACSILFFGPVTDILEDETVFTENLKTLNGTNTFFFNFFHSM